MELDQGQHNHDVGSFYTEKGPDIDPKIAAILSGHFQSGTPDCGKP